MKLLLITKRLSFMGTSGALMVTIGLAGASAQALSVPPMVTPTQDLQNIISKGDQEINRRLTTLNSLSSKINTATRLNSTDRSYLVNEVTAEISGLTGLQTKLNADTTLSTARSDAQSIYTEYRVYALVVPKVWLVKTADDQQATSTKLTTLAGKLQTKITADQTAGKNVAGLQTQLMDMTTQISNSQAISSSLESKVLTLQPSDYNSDHTILSGDAAQLKTAHSDNQTAYSDAKSIVAGLKAL